MLKVILQHRGSDDYGSGEFGASRGGRSHIGIDYSATPGDVVCAPVDGVVTKLGYPYASDQSYRYVEITSSDAKRHRLFYAYPLVKQGDKVFKDHPVAVVQDIAKKYTEKGKMKNHIHYEVLLPDGSAVNPEKL